MKLGKDQRCPANGTLGFDFDAPSEALTEVSVSDSRGYREMK